MGSHGVDTITFIAEQIAPAVQACGTDRFASIESAYAQAASSNFANKDRHSYRLRLDPLPFFRSAIAVAPVSDLSRKQYSSSHARKEERRRVTAYSVPQRQQKTRRTSNFR